MRHPCLQMRTFQDVNINNVLLFVCWCNIRLCLFPASSNQSDLLIPQIGQLSHEQVPYGSNGRHFEYQNHYDLFFPHVWQHHYLRFEFEWRRTKQTQSVLKIMHAQVCCQISMEHTSYWYLLSKKDQFFLLGWVVLVSWPNIINGPCCLSQSHGQVDTNSAEISARNPKASKMPGIQP